WRGFGVIFLKAALFSVVALPGQRHAHRSGVSRRLARMKSRTSSRPGGRRAASRCLEGGMFVPRRRCEIPPQASPEYAVLGNAPRKYSRRNLLTAHAVGNFGDRCGRPCEKETGRNPDESRPGVSRLGAKRGYPRCPSTQLTLRSKSAIQCAAWSAEQ